MRCAKHNEETAVTCGRCETPVCPKCMVHSDVGVRCKSCAPDMGRKRFTGRTSPFLIGGVILAGVLAVGALGSGVFGSGNSVPDYSDYLDQYGYAPADVSANRVVDPWTPEADGTQPSAGHRYVAIEVLVENSGSDGAAYVEPYGFKLKDSEGFTYAPTYEGATPMLGSIELAEGEKTRGWVTFEVDENATLDVLSYGDKDIPLP